MTSKEMLAIRYTFFRNPSHYVLTVIPVITGIVSVLFFQQVGDVINNNQWDLVIQNQYDITERYLNYSKTALVFVISFFLAFRWSLMQKNGSYGFWLTQRVNRVSFYLRALSIFVFESYFAIVLGIVLLNQFIGIQFTVNELIALLLLLFIQIIILIASSILLAEIFPSAELASLLYLIAGLVNLLANNNDSTVIHKILKADLYYTSDDIITPLVSSGILAILFVGLSFIIHTKRSIDL